MKKQNKKNIKVVDTPKKTIVVNLCDVKTVGDLLFNIAIGKCNAGVVITEDELMATYAKGAADAAEFMTKVYDFAGMLKDTIKTCVDVWTEKKTPWYKKLWNKITKPFKKNK